MRPQRYTLEPHELKDSELATIICARYHNFGVEWMIPNIKTQDVYEQTLHARIDSVQSIPAFSSDAIVSKVVEGYNESRISRAREVDDIDKLFNARGQSATSEGFLKGLRLSRVEQILLLRGVVLATERRRIESERGDSQFQFSRRQEAINVAAQCTIGEMATNPVRVMDNDDREKAQRFLANYSTSYIAEIVKREISVVELPEGYDRTSIQGAMDLPIPFARMREKQPDRAVSIFTIEKYDSDNEPEPFGFRARRRNEIDQRRLAGLAEIQARLTDERTSFTYFETFRPFETVEAPDDLPPRKPRITRTEFLEEGDELEEEEYIVLEMESRDESGRSATHVVAENNTVNNACFVLRQEVLDHWKELIGVEFKWENILLSTKKGAEQMGARRMVHAKGSDVPKRVVDYISSDPTEAMLDAFGFLFDKKPNPRLTFFDDDMNPTKYNKLKPALIQKIQQSSEIRAVWQLIRRHGYKKAYNLLQGTVEEEFSTPEDIQQRTKSGVKVNDTAKETREDESTFADDIWSSIVAETVSSL